MTLYHSLRRSGPSFAILSYSVERGFFFCAASAWVADGVANLAPLGDERAEAVGSVIRERVVDSRSDDDIVFYCRQRSV